VTGVRRTSHDMIILGYHNRLRLELLNCVNEMGGNCSRNGAVKSARRIFSNKTREDKTLFI
jgi:hypothetical protein